MILVKKSTQGKACEKVQTGLSTSSSCEGESTPKTCCARYGRDNGCVEGRRNPEKNPEASICTVTGIGASPGLSGIRVLNNYAPLSWNV